MEAIFFFFVIIVPIIAPLTPLVITIILHIRAKKRGENYVGVGDDMFATGID